VTFYDHPFRFDDRGRTAQTDDDAHLHDLIMQVLFTAPGERVMRPDFGCGLRQLVFMPNSDAVAAATQQLVHGSLQRWLGDRLSVDAVQVAAEDERLVVTVAYRRTGESARRVDTFASPAQGAVAPA
jgi:uncharacterized protein